MGLSFNILAFSSITLSISIYLGSPLNSKLTDSCCNALISSIKEIILSSAKEYKIKAGEVDALGNVIKETEPEEMLMLVLPYADLQKLLAEPIRVAFEYKLENENHKNVFIKSTDWLDLKIMFHITASATFDAGEIISSNDK